MVPAERCDTDHRIPYPHGPTTGDNLGPLCRRHHSYKGHRVLHWSTKSTFEHILRKAVSEPVLMEYAG